MLALAAKGPLWGDHRGPARGVDRNSESKNEDGYTMGSCLLRRVEVGDSPFSTGGAQQLVPEQVGSVQTHPVSREDTPHYQSYNTQKQLSSMILGGDIFSGCLERSPDLTSPVARRRGVAN